MRCGFGRWVGELAAGVLALGLTLPACDDAGSLNGVHGRYAEPYPRWENANTAREFWAYASKWHGHFAVVMHLDIDENDRLSDYRAWVYPPRASFHDAVCYMTGDYAIEGGTISGTLDRDARVLELVLDGATLRSFRGEPSEPIDHLELTFPIEKHQECEPDFG